MDTNEKKAIEATVKRVGDKIDGLKFAALDCVAAGAFEVKNKNPDEGIALISMGLSALVDIRDYYDGLSGDELSKRGGE